MHILCPTFGYYVKHEKSNQHYMPQMQVLHNFIFTFLFLDIFHHNIKNEK
jgi:hypothetical protein